MLYLFRSALLLASISVASMAITGYCQHLPQEPQKLSAPGLLTVAQLEKIVRGAKSKRDRKAAKEIEHLKLTERLSSAKLATLSMELPGAQSKAALMMIGDESVFLNPPPDEIPQKAALDVADTRRIMSLAAEYLTKILPKLPNFYAKRFTTSFEDVSTLAGEKGNHKESGLHFVGEYRATVYFRDGGEAMHAEGAEGRGLITRGTFGPILRAAIVDAAHSSTTRWTRWEEGPNGPIVVFRFEVPEGESHFKISSPAAIPTATAYHGEIGIDPNSGTVLRIVVEADPELGSSPMARGDIMVEYAAVAIGGKVYTCPVRSVSVSTTTTVARNKGLNLTDVVTHLNDVIFNDYHVFRSEMRILP